ncbi:hypothetical protein ACS0TY_035352 [Phlomoides rotata]
MVLLQAGTNKNPGRYFYKCPRNLKHQNSFIWCDAWHQHDPPNMMPHFLKFQNTSLSYYAQPSSSSSPAFSHNDLHHEFRNNVSSYASLKMIFKDFVNVWGNKHFCIGCIVMVVWSIFYCFLCILLRSYSTLMFDFILFLCKTLRPVFIKTNCSSS